MENRDPAFSYLRRETLIGSIVEQELDDLVVILLCSHIQRSESILRLDVDRGTVLNKYIDYFGLASWTSNISEIIWVKLKFHDSRFTWIIYLAKLCVGQYFPSSSPRPPSHPSLIIRLLSRHGHLSKLNARHLNRSANKTQVLKYYHRRMIKKYTII